MHSITVFPGFVLLLLLQQCPLGPARYIVPSHQLPSPHLSSVSVPDDMPPPEISPKPHSNISSTPHSDNDSTLRPDINPTRSVNTTMQLPAQNDNEADASKPRREYETPATPRDNHIRRQSVKTMKSDEHMQKQHDFQMDYQNPTRNLELNSNSPRVVQLQQKNRPTSHLSLLGGLESGSPYRKSDSHNPQSESEYPKSKPLNSPSPNVTTTHLDSIDTHDSHNLFDRPRPRPPSPPPPRRPRPRRHTRRLADPLRNCHNICDWCKRRLTLEISSLCYVGCPKQWWEYRRCRYEYSKRLYG